MYQKAAHVKLIEKGTDDNVPKQQFSYSVVYGIDWMKRRKKKLDRSHSQNNDD